MNCMMKCANQLGGVLLFLWMHCLLVFCQVDFDYSNGPNGPAQWGNLNPPAWVQCSQGTKQSPINIAGDFIVQLPSTPLDLVYATTLVHVEIYNNGRAPTVEMVHPNSGNLTISGLTYNLEDFHFHIPSEHLIQNVRFSMEMHLVHKSTSDQRAVVSLLYTLGLPSEFLSQFVGNLPSHMTPNVKTPMEIKLPVFPSHPYFRYNGSLTTPPCTETVVWTVMDHFPTLSMQQLQQLRAAQPGENARPTQPKNGRQVYLFP